MKKAFTLLLFIASLTTIHGQEKEVEERCWEEIFVKIYVLPEEIFLQERSICVQKEETFSSIDHLYCDQKGLYFLEKQRAWICPSCLHRNSDLSNTCSKCFRTYY